MTDYVLLQNFLAHTLRCYSELKYITVAEFRKLRVQTQIDYSVVCQMPRNGRAGCGILVEMPTFEVKSPNLPGPQGNLVLSCVVLEEPNMNMEPTMGTLMSAEFVSQLILDNCHRWDIGGVGIAYADGKAIEDADEFPGLVSYRVRLHMLANRTQAKRVAPPSIQENARVVTLSCSTDGAEIFYTTDGTFPGPSNVAPDGTALRYVEPFELTGPRVYCAAYKEGMANSNINWADNPQPQ